MLMFPRHLEGGDRGAGEGSEDRDHSLRVNPRGEEQGRKGRGRLDQRRQGKGRLGARGQRPEGRRQLTPQ